MIGNPERKVHLMNGPIISFDVSKGTSHAQGFLGYGEPTSRAFPFKHDLDGYEKISKLASLLLEKTGKNPSCIMESTGVYSLPLVAYLLNSGFTVYLISPLESAKMRKAEIRPIKNDFKDCATIAKVYYTKELKPLSMANDVYSDLKEMSRQYQYELNVSVQEKNRYHRCLDAVWPLFDEVILYDSEASLAIVSKFGHPSKIKTKNSILTVLNKVFTGNISKEIIADRVIDYANKHNSGCNASSYCVEETKEMANRVKKESGRLKKLLKKMIQKAKELPEYKLLKTIPNVGDRSAVRLIAEIGDISKFKNKKSFIAFIGLDPMVMQSGKNTGEHLSITKKGNKFLRSTLYLCITNIMRLSPESKIAKFVLKKKSDGLCLKAAKVAGSAKLARIIYSMMINGACYQA